MVCLATLYPWTIWCGDVWSPTQNRLYLEEDFCTFYALFGILLVSYCIYSQMMYVTCLSLGMWTVLNNMGNEMSENVTFTGNFKTTQLSTFYPAITMKNLGQQNTFCYPFILLVIFKSRLYTRIHFSSWKSVYISTMIMSNLR